TPYPGLISSKEKITPLKNTEDYEKLTQKYETEKEELKEAAEK
ncbi:11327_t:CDS:2, partial [Funneliformis geosporum]